MTVAAGKHLQSCRGQDMGHKVRSHLPHGQPAMLEGRAASRHRVTPAPERQAPVINEALIWQDRRGRSGRADPPPAGLGRSHGKSQLEAGLPANPGTLRPPSPHGRGERPELQPSGLSKEITYTSH